MKPEYAAILKHLKNKGWTVVDHGIRRVDGGFADVYDFHIVDPRPMTLSVTGPCLASFAKATVYTIEKALVDMDVVMQDPNRGHFEFGRDYP